MDLGGVSAMICVLVLPKTEKQYIGGKILFQLQLKVDIFTVSIL